MGVEVKFTAIDFKKMGGELNTAMEREFNRAIADEVTLMKIRIQSGKDVNDRTFDDYSPEYLKFRVEGRTSRDGTRKGGGRKGNPPNLIFSGKMQNAIIYNISKAVNLLKAKVFFSSAAEAEKARNIIDQGRDFFGFTPIQIDRVLNRLQSKIK